MATATDRDLSGKVALVTGGSRGLGRAIAQGFAEAGADVAIVSRKLDACTVAAHEVATSTGRRALAFGCHVGRWEDVDAMVEEVYAAFGRIDILVNNAGMSPTYDTIEGVSEELYDKVLAVNLKGPFRLMALVGSRMRLAGGGTIINISSYSAERPDGDAIPYAAAKAGLNAMTVAFAHSLGPEVRVNCIQPGAFLTDISNAWDEDWLERETQRYALRRAGRPDEIVGAAVYFASDASSFATGSVLRLDGGIP
jgi:NAD(P)-dependent dehydrogenase (short-subunit alcohol dehydrogenase family)